MKKQMYQSPNISLVYVEPQAMMYDSTTTDKKKNFTIIYDDDKDLPMDDKGNILMQ